jgi:prophage maintenance system killer protein
LPTSAWPNRPCTRRPPPADGNKRAAYLAMLEFLARNGRQFVATDVNAAIDMMVKIAGSEVDPAEIEDWIRRQLH